ncbi:hypothetical protein [Chordicoccus furentiruminis]|jgi:hypothetical protein|uniref:hypothetical protein n=1 Tax=Chordicoccus furentiruminis TaxID=2709410 RepID=UPI0023A88C7F|nr:hypothetical protein [Chordicoccus furentiruminis]
MQLKEWKIDGETISGRVCGSSRYPDGTVIQTSRVIAAAFDGELYLISTKNSTYECYERDYIGPAAELRVFNQEMIDDMGRTRQISLQADGKGGRRNVL